MKETHQLLYPMRLGAAYMHKLHGRYDSYKELKLKT